MKKKSLVHYIYEINFLCGEKNRYYIGKRSSYDPYNDGYAGSGKFCKAYFAKYGKIEGITYDKIVLEINPTKELNAERERIWVGDAWKTDPLCMNQMSGGINAGYNTSKESTRKKLSKPILQYDIDGNLIKEWDGAKWAAQALGLDQSSISKCCNGTKYKTTGGFVWKHKH